MAESERGMKKMMGCGHAANSVNGHGQPACAICAGIHPGAELVVCAPDLTGRVAICNYGHKEVPSDVGLPFFEHRPDQKRDSYYCGCFGWD